MEASFTAALWEAFFLWPSIVWRLHQQQEAVVKLLKQQILKLKLELDHEEIKSGLEIKCTSDVYSNRITPLRHS